MRPEVNLAKRLSKIFCLRPVSWDHEELQKSLSFGLFTVTECGRAPLNVGEGEGEGESLMKENSSVLICTQQVL